MSIPGGDVVVPWLESHGYLTPSPPVGCDGLDTKGSCWGPDAALRSRARTTRRGAVCAFRKPAPGTTRRGSHRLRLAERAERAGSLRSVMCRRASRAAARTVAGRGDCRGGGVCRRGTDGVAGWNTPESRGAASLTRTAAALGSARHRETNRGLSRSACGARRTCSFQPGAWNMNTGTLGERFVGAFLSAGWARRPSRTRISVTSAGGGGRHRLQPKKSENGRVREEVYVFPAMNRALAEDEELRDAPACRPPAPCGDARQPPGSSELEATRPPTGAEAEAIELEQALPAPNRRDRPKSTTACRPAGPGRGGRHRRRLTQVEACTRHHRASTPLTSAWRLPTLATPGQRPAAQRFERLLLSQQQWLPEHRRHDSVQCQHVPAPTGREPAMLRMTSLIVMDEDFDYGVNQPGYRMRFQATNTWKGAQYNFYGWGATSNNGSGAGALRKGDNNKKIEVDWISNYYFTSNMGSNIARPCAGDYGGPVVREGIMETLTTPWAYSGWADNDIPLPWEPDPGYCPESDDFVRFRTARAESELHRIPIRPDVRPLHVVHEQRHPVPPVLVTREPRQPPAIASPRRWPAREQRAS